MPILQLYRKRARNNQIRMLIARYAKRVTVRNYVIVVTLAAPLFSHKLTISREITFTLSPDEFSKTLTHKVDAPSICIILYYLHSSNFHLVACARPWDSWICITQILRQRCNGSKAPFLHTNERYNCIFEKQSNELFKCQGISPIKLNKFTVSIHILQFHFF